MLLNGDRRTGRLSRVFLSGAAIMCLLGIYLTRTRAVWLALMVAVVLCALLARRARKGFIAVIVAAMIFVGFTWATFVSSDRQAGGVGSQSEVEDRLNISATAIWAIEQEPIFGWGLGRFAQVNTEHHQQYSTDINFRRGFAFASHENELGIGAELGLTGLALWLLVLFLLLADLLRAFRTMPDDRVAGRTLGLLAFTMFTTWAVCGFTADLRFFDFANLLTFVVAGAAVGASRAGPGTRRPDLVEPSLAIPRSAPTSARWSTLETRRCGND
jgi:O-antigen ligase